jgi:galactitol-specific phosphotransferase system IIB component
VLKLEKIMFCKSLRASSHVITANIAHRFASSIARIDANNHAIIIIKSTSHTMPIVCEAHALDDDVEHVNEYLAQHST